MHLQQLLKSTDYLTVKQKPDLWAGQAEVVTKDRATAEMLFGGTDADPSSRAAAQQAIDEEYFRELYFGQQAQEEKEHGGAGRLQRAQARGSVSKKKNTNQEAEMRKLVEREKGFWTEITVDLVCGDAAYMALFAKQQHELACHQALDDDNKILDEFYNSFQTARRHAPSLSKHLPVGDYPAGLPTPDDTSWTSAYKGERPQYRAFFGEPQPQETPKILPLPAHPPLTPLYGGPKSGKKAKSRESAAEKAQRERQLNLEILLSEVLLEIERRRDASVPRCFYHAEWENDPHELAKLDAVYQQRERALVDKILAAEADLAATVSRFDDNQSELFADLSRSAGVKWELRSGVLKRQSVLSLKPQ